MGGYTSGEPEKQDSLFIPWNNKYKERKLQSIILEVSNPVGPNLTHSSYG